MNSIQAVHNYLNKMIADVSGMKVLLLDEETTPIISMVVTQSHLLSREIYLIDKLDNQREPMRHLKCICFIRPTAHSLNKLIEEIRDRRSYSDYYVYFSNSLKKSDIERLAEADEYELVREVQEYYADYLAINPDLFSFQLPTHLFDGNVTSWDPSALSRTVDGLSALLLSLKKKPLIRYPKTSVLGKKLAHELQYHIQQEGPLFDFRKVDTPPILLILDRKNDPVTPLLNQWTYQALVHEMLGIQNGRVDLSNIQDVRPEMKEVILSYEYDTFYQKSMFLNLGDLGNNIKEYFDEYQLKHKSTKNIESIADMKKFVEDYPEFRKLSGNVSKHVTLVSELSRLVAKECLLEIGELEQSLACFENHVNDSKALQEHLESPKIPLDSKLRLVLLYALRYEKTVGNQIAVFTEMLKRDGLSAEKAQHVQAIIEYAGADQRMEDIFLNKDILAKTKNVFKGLKGVENVYTQHTPVIVQNIQDCIKGKLKEQLFPFLEGSTRDRPQDLIVFMVGGVSYAEAREVYKINAANTGTRIILGGTTIHNTKSFLGGLLPIGRKSLGKVPLNTSGLSEPVNKSSYL